LNKNALSYLCDNYCEINLRKYTRISRAEIVFRKTAEKSSKKMLKKNINDALYLSPSSSFLPEILRLLLDNTVAL